MFKILQNKIINSKQWLEDTNYSRNIFNNQLRKQTISSR